jgi:hypothetical protein
VTPERRRLRRGGLPGESVGVDASGVGRVQGRGHRVGVAVVGGDGAVREEMPAALLQSGEVAGVVADLGVGDGAEALDGVGPARRRRFQIPVRAERRRDPRGDRRIGRQSGVRRQVVGGVVGGGQEVDAEPLEQGSRPVTGILE